MVRIIGFLVGLAFAGIALISLAVDLTTYFSTPHEETAEHEFHKYPRDAGLPTAGLFGKSDNAQQLIELINQSPMFSDASFRGPTRLDTRSQKEIFDLTAKTSTGEEG